MSWERARQAGTGALQSQREAQLAEGVWPPTSDGSIDFYGATGQVKSLLIFWTFKMLFLCVFFFPAKFSSHSVVVLKPVKSCKRTAVGDRFCNVIY